jgi:D-tyrosyl-tRNA(Tyr) deacylase
VADPPVVEDAPVRAVVQRVSEAHVTVDGRRIAAIGAGLLVLVGVTHSDTPATAAALAHRVWNLRILADERSASDVGAPLLVVSQFTLYADTRRGRRPSWNSAAPATTAAPLVDSFVGTLRTAGATVEVGEFGADMKVGLVNDGPVTLVLDAD